MTTAVSKGLGIPSQSGTFKAYDDDLVDKQFRFAKLTSTGIVDFAVAATDKILGVINNHPNAATGADVEVIVGGEAKIKLAGTVSAGDRLTSDAAGEAVAMTPGNTTVNYSGGIALEDGEDDDIIRMLVTPAVVLV